MHRNASKLDTWQGSGRTCKILVSPEETGTRDISALLVEFEPGEGTPVHTHDGIELMFVLEGQGISVEDGKESKISTNSVVLAEKGVPHQIVNGSDGSMHMICVYVPPLPDSYIKANYNKIPKVEE
jgi:quercetin dioxygenase-like cupin family protein